MQRNDGDIPDGNTDRFLEQFLALVVVDGDDPLFNEVVHAGVGISARGAAESRARKGGVDEMVELG